MSSIAAFLILAVVYYIGELVGTKTKAWIPSVFVIACLFLAGYWTFFPKDIVNLAGMGAPLGGTLVIMLCITHMGTIISIKQLLQQWKVIVITLCGLAGMVALGWFVCHSAYRQGFCNSRSSAPYRWYSGSHNDEHRRYGKRPHYRCGVCYSDVCDAGLCWLPANCRDAQDRREKAAGRFSRR